MASPQPSARVWIHPIGSVSSAQRKIWSAKMPKVASVTLATSATDNSITHVVWSAASASPDASIAWYGRFRSGDIYAVTPAWMIDALRKKRRPSAAKDVEYAWVDSSSSAKRARTPSSSSTDDELLPLPPRSVMIGDVEIFGHSFGTLPLFVGYTGQYEAASAPAQVQVLTDVTAAFTAASEVTSGSKLLIDTADAYSAPNTLNGGEQVIAAALRAKTTPPSTVIATKGGMRRVGPLSRDWETVDFSPGGVKRAIRASHAALNTGVADVAAHAPIFLWQIHHVKGSAGTRVDATVTAMRAAKEMQDAGLVRHLGLSNCSVAQIEAVIDDGITIASVQNSLSLWDRNAAKPVRGDKPVTSMHGVLKLCKHHMIAFIAHGPLGGLRLRDKRRDLKRDYPALAALAARKGTSAHALALAVLRYRWPKTVITIAGARTSAHAIDSVLGAAAVRLTRAELDDLWPPPPSSTSSSSSSSGAKRRRIPGRHSYAQAAPLVFFEVDTDCE
jgi:aryl-alcohol dehydrogenase-like predicted oxidoreductase